VRGPLSIPSIFYFIDPQIEIAKAARPKKKRRALETSAVSQGECTTCPSAIQTRIFLCVVLNKKQVILKRKNALLKHLSEKKNVEDLPALFKTLAMKHFRSASVARLVVRLVLLL